MSDNLSALEMMHMILESLWGGSAHGSSDYDRAPGSIAFGILSWTLGAYYWNEPL
jgi:hypothetical protein